METQTLPEFKYNPNALKLEIIIKREAVCPVCNEKREYVYDGPFYSEEEVEDICPWCIKDGFYSLPSVLIPKSLPADVSPPSLVHWVNSAL